VLDSDAVHVREALRLAFAGGPESDAGAHAGRASIPEF
jgi:hypothetical protein